MRQIGYKIKEAFYCAQCVSSVLYTVPVTERELIWENDDTETPIACSRCNKALDAHKR